MLYFFTVFYPNTKNSFKKIGIVIWKNQYFRTYWRQLKLEKNKPIVIKSLVLLLYWAHILHPWVNVFPPQNLSVFYEMKSLLSNDDHIPEKSLMKIFSPVLCTRLECFTWKTIITWFIQGWQSSANFWNSVFNMFFIWIST